MMSSQLNLSCFFNVNILYAWFMLFNATLSNISVISWLSVLLVEETGDPEKTTDLSQVSDKLDHTMNIMLYTLP
jgi:hypothetical protein